jgi:hypothetical protein
MQNLLDILINLVIAMFDHVNMLASNFLTGEMSIWTDSGLTVAFALGAASHGNITESIMYGIRRWHGNINERFAAIDNLVNLITEHQPDWTIPADMFAKITADRNQLQLLINRCRSSMGSRADRELRNTLLKSTVSFCRLHVKIWACTEFSAGVLTADDVHLLGFLLPGETGGIHVRTKATDTLASVKVKIVNEDFIRVSVDQASAENAAQAAHGWPTGVKYILIVITADDGKTEVYRQFTTHLHNTIRMPDGLHGKQFIVKAAFLRHVNDAPRFGNELTFSMPLTTIDLITNTDRLDHEDLEEKLREIERQRQEIERLIELRRVKS